MNKIATILIFIFAFSFSFNAFGQSPYQLDTKREITLLSLAVGGHVAGKLIIDDLDPLSVTAVNQLDANQLGRFDRSAVNFYSTKAQDMSDVLLYGSYTLPFILLMDNNYRSDLQTVGVMATEVFLLDVALRNVTKGLTRRSRPLAYNPEVPIDKRIDTSARLSFFSGHTSRVSAMAFFTAKVWSDYHPDSKWKPLVWTSATLVSATTGYLRYRGGKHFPTDVITGFSVGAALGILIPELHKKRNNDKKVKVAFNAGVNNAGVTLNW